MNLSWHEIYPAKIVSALLFGWSQMHSKHPFPESSSIGTIPWCGWTHAASDRSGQIRKGLETPAPSYTTHMEPYEEMDDFWRQGLSFCTQHLIFQLKLFIQNITGVFWDDFHVRNPTLLLFCSWTCHWKVGEHLPKDTTSAAVRCELNATKCRLSAELKKQTSKCKIGETSTCQKKKSPVLVSRSRCFYGRNIFLKLAPPLRSDQPWGIPGCSKPRFPWPEDKWVWMGL